jgi:DNA-binding transcriptional LysR family regulator
VNSVEIRDLEYFLACCEAGSFTAAARTMHIVQSAMSSAVARLEHDLGVPLFDRSVTPVAVTEHGAALRAGAQHILAAVQAARDDVAAVSGQIRGTVVLGSTLNTGPLDLAAVLADVRDHHPGVVIHLRQSTAGSAGNLRAILDGSMDIALTAISPDPVTGQPARRVVLHPLVSEALVFACRPDHPLGGQPEVSVGDLAEETILRFPPGWGVRETVDRVLGELPGATEIADYALMAKLIRDGFGTTLIPESAVAAVAGLRSVPVADPRLRWSLSAAISASRRPTAATTAVLGALTQASAPSAATDRAGPSTSPVSAPDSAIRRTGKSSPC